MSMVDEDVVQSLSRIRVHATERVEGKRNEAKAVLVTDIPIRVDVVVVEQLEPAFIYKHSKTKEGKWEPCPAAFIRTCSRR